MTTAAQIISFLFNLKFTFPLSAGVEVMNPFADAETQRVCQEFYTRFYNDDHRRDFIIGINPGRFGGGITGIPFTDPIRLKSKCNIQNTWVPRQELSSVFIYDMIDAFGGVNAFYSRFYYTSISPLGFTRNGKNLNYYDDKILAETIKPFAKNCFQKQLQWGNNSVAYCLGEGANYKFLNKFNNEHSLFKKIIPLAHPRFIMQYKLKFKEYYIAKYLQAFEEGHKLI